VRRASQSAAGPVPWPHPATPERRDGIDWGMTDPGTDALARFFATSPAARKATRPLARDARVALDLASGPARFSMAGGEARVEPGTEPDPDFTLVLPEPAVKHITAIQGDDVGEFGIAFFKLLLAREPEQRVRVHIHASTARLVSHGYLGVLAAGGAKVAWWLLKNGVRNPKAAIDRLRGAR